jgi:hypothetical protein
LKRRTLNPVAHLFIAHAREIAKSLTKKTWLRERVVASASMQSQSICLFELSGMCRIIQSRFLTGLHYAPANHAS